MKIPASQLLQLMQILKDSMEIQMGYDWNFKSTHAERKKLYDELLKSIVSEQIIEIIPDS